MHYKEFEPDIYLFTEDIPELGVKKGQVFCLDHSVGNAILVFENTAKNSPLVVIIDTNGNVDHKRTTEGMLAGWTLGQNPARQVLS